MDYCIRKLLGLTEENFITDENWLETMIENHEIVHKVKGTWTNTCTSCLYCSSENVIKHSPMEHKIRIPHLYGNKTILDLKVQRFICKDCRKTWVADCPLVPKNSNISYDLACQIMSMSLKKGHKSALVRNMSFLCFILRNIISVGIYFHKPPKICFSNKFKSSSLISLLSLTI